MGDPVTMLAVGSTIAGGASSIFKGIGGQQADEMQAQRAEAAAFAAKTNAYATDSQYLTESRKSLAAIDAIRASAGVDIDSPTGIALRDEMQGAYDVRRITAVNNLRDQASQDLMDASYLHAAGDQSLFTGILGAISSVGGTVAKGFLQQAPSFSPSTAYSP